MAPATGVDSSAVYYELSPTLVWLVRICNIITLCMVVLSIIFCFVKAPDHSSYYLLVVNLGISVIVCLVVNWWYRSGDLGSEKFWFILLIGAVILFQCLATDLFVFKEDETPATPTPTPRHNSTMPFSWASNLPASTKPRVP